VVYFPFDCYRVDGNPNPVTIPATVHLIEGMGSCIAAHGNNCSAGGNFSNERTPFTSSANGNSIFENFFIDKYDVGCMTYTGAGSFTMTDVFNLTCFQGNAPGNIFSDDSAITGISVTGGGHFFCVQCNVETSGAHIQANNETAWILGFKTEGDDNGGPTTCYLVDGTTPTGCGAIWAHNNATVEVLGTWLYGAYGTAFLLQNSQVSIANATVPSSYGPCYSEVRNTSAPATLPCNSSWNGTDSTALYLGNTETMGGSGPPPPPPPPPPVQSSPDSLAPGTYEISSGSSFADGGFGYNGATPAVQFYSENDNLFQHWKWNGSTFANNGWAGYYMADAGNGTVTENTSGDTWTLTASGEGYIVQDGRTGLYLENSGNVLAMGSTPTVWAFAASSTGTPAGSLTGSATTSSAAVNLTTEGTTDWIHWGDTAVNRKSGVTPQLSNYTVVGASPVIQYSNDPRPESWTDGTPTVSATNDFNGAFTYTVGRGFSLTAPADTTSRKLILHVGGWNSAGKLTAHLSDGSAVDYTNTTTGSTGQYDGNYTLIYNAANSGQTLTVTWTIASGTTGHVSLDAAALQ
jgi:hypothetical protein